LKNVCVSAERCVVGVNVCVLAERRVTGVNDVYSDGKGLGSGSDEDGCESVGDDASLMS